jgi:hypothetical protein
MASGFCPDLANRHLCHLYRVCGHGRACPAASVSGDPAVSSSWLCAAGNDRYFQPSVRIASETACTPVTHDARGGMNASSGQVFLCESTPFSWDDMRGENDRRDVQKGDQQMDRTDADKSTVAFESLLAQEKIPPLVR